MKRVEPSVKASKSVAHATVEALSPLGGRFMATLRAGFRGPTACETPLARCWASRGADFLACRAPETRADPSRVRSPGSYVPHLVKKSLALDAFSMQGVFCENWSRCGALEGSGGAAFIDGLSSSYPRVGYRMTLHPMRAAFALEDGRGMIWSDLLPITRSRVPLTCRRRRCPPKRAPMKPGRRAWPGPAVTTSWAAPCARSPR